MKRIIIDNKKNIITSLFLLLWLLLCISIYVLFNSSK